MTSLKSCFFVAGDSIGRVTYPKSAKNFGGKTHNLGWDAQKLKSAQPVICLPGLLGKNIKNYASSNVFLFTSLISMASLLFCNHTRAFHELNTMCVVQPCLTKNMKLHHVHSQSGIHYYRPNILQVNVTNMKLSLFSFQVKAGVFLNMACLLVANVAINTLGVWIFDIKIYPQWAPSFNETAM